MIKNYIKMALFCFISCIVLFCIISKAIFCIVFIDPRETENCLLFKTIRTISRLPQKFGHHHTIFTAYFLPLVQNLFLFHFYIKSALTKMPFDIFWKSNVKTHKIFKVHTKDLFFVWPGLIAIVFKHYITP